MIQTSSQTERAIVRPTLQRRSARTQQRILKVVDQLLLEGRFDQATVQEIVQRAECSIGAFYGRFKDKNAALYKFYDRRCRQLESKITVILDVGRLRANSLAGILSEFIDATVAHTLAHASTLRADVIKFTAADNDPFVARARVMNRLLRQSLESVLLAARDEYEHPDHRLAALFVLSMVGGLTRDAITMGQRLMETGFCSAFMQAELNRAVLGYLGISGGPMSDLRR